MSRRSNLNTIRRGFNWDSHWTTNISNYTQIVWLDIKITSFLRGVFYVLRLPSSSYIIRRFVSSFVIIETDVWLYNKTSFTKFIPNSYYFSYLVYKLRSMLFNIQLHKKKIVQLHKHKLFSISSIVSHLFNKGRIVIRKKKKMQISKVRAFDTNTLKQRDASRYDLSTWNIVTAKKWVVRRKKSKVGTANLSRMLLWRSKTMSTRWQSASIRTVARNSAAHRYLWLSSRFMHSYFIRFFKRKIGRFIKCAYRHRHTLVLPTISNVYAILHKYRSLLKQLCNYTRMAYLSRNLRNIRMVFRLLNFQVVNAMRTHIFSRLWLPSGEAHNVKQSAACAFVASYCSGSVSRGKRSYSSTKAFSSIRNNVRKNNNMLFNTQRRSYTKQFKRTGLPRYGSTKYNKRTMVQRSTCGNSLFDAMLQLCTNVLSFVAASFRSILNSKWVMYIMICSIFFLYMYWHPTVLLAETEVAKHPFILVRQTGRLLLEMARYEETNPTICDAAYIDNWNSFLARVNALCTAFTDKEVLKILETCSPETQYNAQVSLDSLIEARRFILKYLANCSAQRS